ncbi:hypothetical protein [Streptomyces turgidiscabies]|uniref:hypothetical protein n=1 Tax=Streptomyces turgidiscabies TaxID=85558 RepID=UPI0038F60AE4
MGGIGVLAGVAVTALASVVCAVIAARAAARAAAENREAQLAAAQPAATAANLSVLEATVKRVDQENEQNRAEIRGLRALIRAYAWTVDRLISRMRDARIGPEPDDIDPLVRDHMRTGA